MNTVNSLNFGNNHASAIKFLDWFMMFIISNLGKNGLAKQFENSVCH